MHRPKITVAGSAMVDLVTYIDRMPREGETIEAPHFSMGYGGKGANQAVAAALLGAEVAMVGKVGDDLFGPGTLDNFRRFGIDCSFVDMVQGESSGVAPIFVDPHSKNSILIVKGANLRVSPADIDRAAKLIRSSDLVILQLEIALETVYHCIESCREWGIPVILNPAPADTRLDLARIGGIFLFAPNETELASITGMPVTSLDQARTAAASLLDKGLDRILVTLGEKGCLLVTRDETLRVPGIPVASIDSTGAGDAFIGSLAVRYLETKDLEESMRWANAYAALSTTGKGTQKSFASRTAFEEFLKKTAR
jgi:ribokinase